MLQELEFEEQSVIIRKDQDFVENEDYKKADQDRENRKTGICDVCGKEFTNSYTMKFHKETVHQNIRKFACEDCYRSFSTKYKLNRHRSIHSNIRSFPCHSCSRNFKTRDILVKHSRTHELTVGPFSCDFSSCFQVFKFRSGLEYHQKLKHPSIETINARSEKKKEKLAPSPPRYICDICNKKFLKKNNLSRHLFTHGEKNFECPDCSVKSFKSKYDLQKHRKIHQQVYFKCDYCPRTFLKQSSCNEHIQKHSKKKIQSVELKKQLETREPVGSFDVSEENFEYEILDDPLFSIPRELTPNNSHFTCDICDQFFNTKEEIEKHVKDHLKVARKSGKPKKKSMCEYCSLFFSSSHDLRKHVRRIHQKGSHKFKCDKCEKSFAILYDLKRHQVKHVKEKNFECEHCNQRFKSLSAAKQHIKNFHSDETLPKEKCFKCNFCEREYFHERHLEYHKRKHQEDRRYSCPREDCPEKFYYSDAIKWHLIRQHHEPPPYSCTKCSKPFIHEKTWETHEKLHEQNGGFSMICPICAALISESRHMKRHLRTHDEKSFKCNFCSSSFRERHQLTRHISKQHGNEIQS